MTDTSLLKISRKCPVQNNIYYQKLTQDCLGKCPQSSKAAVQIDRTRGIPCAGNVTSSGIYQTKAFLMSYGARFRRGKRQVIYNSFPINAFRQRKEQGCTKSTKPLSNFN